jgi:uncharacterized membrane protein
MPTLLESAKRIGSRIGLDDEKGFAAAIFVALIVVSAVIAGYYAVYGPQKEPYHSIYLLDTNKKAVDYPEFLVAGQNSTFNVWINVENHIGETADYQVQVKIAKNLSNFPVQAQASAVYEILGLESNGEPWQRLVTLTIDEVGNHTVVFELWQFENESWTFTHNYCVLKVQVI